MDRSERPVVFLDIDGVLNHVRLYRWMRDRAGPPAEWLDPACIARVNTLCKRTGAKLVISSAWRTYEIPGTTERGWRGAAEVLRARGLTAEVIDGTPVLESPAPGSALVVAAGRWPEIRAWLDAHPEVDRWVVLDDMLLPEVPPGRHVRTDIEVGLTNADVERAVECLR